MAFGDIDWGQIATGMPTDPSWAQMWNQRVGGQPALPQATPEQIAQQAAARGIPPPQTDIQPSVPGVNDVPPQATQAWRNDYDTMNGTGGLGATLAGTPQGPATTTGGPSVGAPQSLAPPAASTDVSAVAKKPEDNQLLTALKGVKAPAGPELQKISSPSAPRPTTQVKGGNLIALLNSLNAGQTSGALDRKLPSTLAQALLGRG